MAIQTNVQHCVVVHTIKGESTTQDILSYLYEESPSWHDLPSIWDITDLACETVSTADIRLLASGILSRPSRKSNHKIAILVKSNLGHGLVRMLQGYLGCQYQDCLQVHRSADQAYQWLYFGQE